MSFSCFFKENFVDHPDTVLVREVLGRRGQEEESEDDADDETDSEEDVEENSGGEDSEDEAVQTGSLSSRNPFAVLEDSS